MHESVLTGSRLPIKFNRRVSMAIVTKRVVSAGYEKFYDEAMKELETVEEDVRKLVEARVNKLNEIITLCTEEIEVEVPDVVEEETAEGEEEPVATDYVG
jgi:hypothetical protein